MNRPARSLVESALLAALGAVLVLVSFYIPLLGIFAGVVSPLPIAFVVIRHGIRWGFLSSIVTLTVLFPFVSPFTAIGLWALYGAMGVALGYSVRKHLQPERTVALMAGATMVGLLVDFAGAYLATGLTLRKYADQMVKAFELAKAANEKILGPNPVFDEMAKNLTAEFLLTMLPSLLILTSFTAAWLNFEIIRRILPKFGYSMGALRPFARWIMPEALGHAWILSFIALTLQEFYMAKFPAGLTVAQNVYAAASLVLTVDALACLSFYLQNSGMPKAVSGLFVFMAVSVLLSSPGLGVAAEVFGMIDVLFDVRHVRYPELQGI